MKKEIQLIPSMIITNIEQQKKNSKRFSVYLDGVYEFGVSSDNLLRFQLFEGKELTTAEKQAIVESESLMQAKAAALRFRSYRPRSRFEIEHFLSSKGFETGVIEHAVAYLTTNNLIDDLAFAKMLCRDTLLRKPMGETGLRTVLIKKGIQKDIIDDILPGFISEESERSSAMTEAKKKYRRLTTSSKKLDPIAVKRRLLNHLLHRGYTPATSHNVVQQIMKKAYHD